MEPMPLGMADPDLTGTSRAAISSNAVWPEQLGCARLPFGVREDDPFLHLAHLRNGRFPSKWQPKRRCRML